MKYLINGVLFMVIVGTIIVGCEKEELPTNIDNSYENTIYQTSKKTLQKNKSSSLPWGKYTPADVAQRHNELVGSAIVNQEKIQFLILNLL